MIGHGEPHQRAGDQVGLDHRQRHIAPAYAFAQQRMFCAQVREAPGLGAGNGIVAPFGEARPVGEHQLDMVAPGAGRDRAHAPQRMVGRGHGHHRHRSRRHALYALDAGRQGARQADDGAAIQHHGSDRAQRFDMEAQLDGWKFASEGAQHLSQSFRRQHDVNGEIDFRLQPVEQPLHLGA